jgi:hypothetical protein
VTRLAVLASELSVASRRRAFDAVGEVLLFVSVGASRRQPLLIAAVVSTQH